MVKWENDKNVYILGAALAALNASITNEIAEAVIAGWSTCTLGEPPTLRAVKDQIKKLSSSSPTTTVKKTGVKKPKAAKGKGKADKGKKRVRDDDDEAEEEDEEQGEDGGNEEGPAKKLKVAFKQEDVDGDEDGDEEV